MYTHDSKISRSNKIKFIFLLNKEYGRMPVIWIKRNTDVEFPMLNVAVDTAASPSLDMIHSKIVN